MRKHLRREVVVGDLAGGVVHDAGAAERRVHQDAGAERADYAADAVDAEHVERVVVAERVLDHGAEEQADHADHETEHDRTHRTGVTGRRCHRHKSGHRTRDCAEHRGMALDDPLREHPRQRRRRSCDEGVGHGERSAAIGFEVRSGVEAEPAHPQQRGADHGHGQRMRSHQVLAVAGPLADQERADETGDAGVDVHHGAACEVDRTFLEDPAGVGVDFIEFGLRRRLGRRVTRCSKRLDRIRDRVRSGPVPNHVRDREIDQRHPERDEQRHRRELHAFGERADDESGGDRREGHLEADIYQLRDVGIDTECRRLGVRRHAYQEGLREAADEIRPAGEGKAVTVKRPDDDHDAYGVENLHQHREHVLGADQTAIEQRQAGNRHQQHQHCRCQHPGVISLVDGWLGVGGGRGEHADCEGRQSRAIGTFERHLVYS